MGHNRRRDRMGLWATISDAAVAQVVAPLPDAETILHHRARLQHLARALARMPGRQRTAFVLHRVQGKTLRDTAEIMQIAPSYAWKLVREAYLHLRAKGE